MVVPLGLIRTVIARGWVARHDLRSVAHVSFIELNFVFAAHLAEFVFVRSCPVMSFLILDVREDLFDI